MRKNSTTNNTTNNTASGSFNMEDLIELSRKLKEEKTYIFAHSDDINSIREYCINIGIQDIAKVIQTSYTPSGEVIFVKESDLYRYKDII